MKVEVDADELCRMQRDLTRYKADYDYIRAEAHKLERELRKYEPIGEEMGWVPESKFSDYRRRVAKQIVKLNDVVDKLSGERDWWKGRAQERTASIESVKDILSVYSLSRLNGDAKCYGYDAD